MNKILQKCVAYCFCLLGCAYGVVPTSNDMDNDAGDSGIAVKSCHPSDAQYAVVFKLLSGNCDNVDDHVVYQWVYASGQPNVLPNCQDHGSYSPCTSIMDLYCTSWLYKEQLSGQLNWNPSGSYAIGDLTFTTYNLKDNSLSCSSVYETTYVRQWEAAQ